MNNPSEIRNKVAIGIQSTVYPSEPLFLDDWRLYIKVRNVKKIALVKNLSIRINQVLNQTLE